MESSSESSAAGDATTSRQGKDWRKESEEVKDSFNCSVSAMYVCYNSCIQNKRAIKRVYVALPLAY